MVIEGRCKINLALNVGERLSNGYHKVKMIMQEVSLCDKIWLNFGKSGVSLSCSSSSIPNDSSNIAYKAAELFIKKTHCDGVEIYIEKNIPSQAGLGGGSADAAAVLKGMNEYYGYPLTEDELLKMGLSLGADVPFCIKGGTALSEGIGEILTPINSLIKTNILIVKPDAGMSTPFAYKRLDEMGFEKVDVDKVLLSLEEGDMDKLCKYMGNVFETVAKDVVPEVFDIKESLLSQGAEAAMMSGSGTAVFGIFTDDDALNVSYECMKEKYTHTYMAKML